MRFEKNYTSINFVVGFTVVDGKGAIKETG